MEKGQERQAYVVVGPTAVGKSAYAVELALAHDGEIVSADSMQVYIGLDKGTAKPTKEEMRGIPHHMLDVADPRFNYSVAEFAAQARGIIEDIFARGKMPIICGGSGLYVNSLIYDMNFGTDSSSRSITYSPDSYKTLVRTDPLAAWRIHPNNEKSVRRALERAKTKAENGELHSFEDSFIPTKSFTPLIHYLTMNRKDLYKRIDARVDTFVANGLVEEVRVLLAEGVSRETTAMQGIGYKEIAAYLAGETSLADAIQEIKYATHKLAKRQETWFTRYPKIDSEIRMIKE